MKLTNPEKLMLLMLGEIYDKLGLTEFDTNLLRSAIYSENTWALDWEMSGVVGSDGEETPEDVKDVVEYLDMWSFLEEAYATFDEEGRSLIAKTAEPLGKHVRFPGFDGNNEGELLSIARILVEDMGRFSRFAGRDLNSHVPLRESYARMLKIFESLRGSLGGVRMLGPEQVAEVLKARRNPSS